MSEEQSLKQKTAKGLFWGGLSSSVQQLLGLLFGVVLGRLLDPADYGMIGMLAIFPAIASALQESGFVAALANREKVSDKDYNAVFWFSISFSAVLYIFLQFSSYTSPFLNRMIISLVMLSRSGSTGISSL